MGSSRWLRMEVTSSPETGGVNQAFERAALDDAHLKCDFQRTGMKYQVQKRVEHVGRKEKRHYSHGLTMTQPHFSSSCPSACPPHP